MAQFARPDADTHIGNYEDQAGGTSDIFESIDEASPSDADYIRSPAGPTSEVYVCALSSVTDPVSASNHVMRMRTSPDLSGQQSLFFTQQLRQDYVSETMLGTLIASQSVGGFTDSATWTTSARTLTAGEAGAITDYSALFYRFIVTAV